MAAREIVAIGGGWFCEGLARFLVELTGRERPRMLYIGTAMAEHPEGALRTYDRFAGLADVSRLELFPWPPDELQSLILESDLVFVGGGNTANMLALWRVHGIDELLREALDRGVVLSGSSAGGICWFERGVTDSFGPQLGGMECLGFLQGSFCPHWNDEELRRPRYHELLRNGFPDGYAADAGVALRFVDGELREVVACDDGSKAYRVEVRGGAVVETPIEARAV
ncbi:MAG TPA: peptidase E [Gaiellaceae bacterium]|nr:peptidase E [Gaiellaceae bacterium]